MQEFSSLFGAAKPIIGMLHLLPLPGSPQYRGDFNSVLEHVLGDAQALIEGGVHALLMENYGDAPFFPRRVPAETATHMTAAAYEVRRRFSIPLGVNVLRNDAQTALAIASAVGASFIRVNVLCGVRATDQGIIEGVAHELLRDRRRLGADEVLIFADVNVKHSAPLGRRETEDEVGDLVHRAKADAIIVSGAATGGPIDLAELRQVRSASAGSPILVGSGASAENIELHAPLVDGWIVGSYFKQKGVIDHPVDRQRVCSLAQQISSLQDMPQKNP